MMSPGKRHWGRDFGRGHDCTEHLIERTECQVNRREIDDHLLPAFLAETRTRDLPFWSTTVGRTMDPGKQTPLLQRVSLEKNHPGLCQGSEAQKREAKRIHPKVLSQLEPRFWTVFLFTVAKLTSNPPPVGTAWSMIRSAMVRRLH